jgi:hypothetical protein
MDSAISEKDQLELRHLYLGAFAFRFGAGMVGWLLTIFDVFNIPFLEDALHYEELASEVADDWLAGHSSQWLSEAIEGGHHAWGIVAVIAAFYFLTGGIRALPLLLAFYALITAWVPVLTYKIGRQLGAPDRAAYLGGWLVAGSPAFAFWSGALYKEGLILLVLSLAVYYTLILQETGSWKSLLIVVACLPALFALRFYLAMMMAGILFVGMLFGRSKDSDMQGWSAVRQVVVALAFAGVLVAVGFTDRAQQFVPESVEDGLEKIQSSRRDLASYSSGFHKVADVGTTEGALQFLPIGLAYFLAAPFCWQFGSLRQNICIPETLIWVLMYPFVLIGFKQVWRKHPQGAVLLILLSAAICCFYAIFSGNIGTIYRMRIQVWLLWAPLAAWGWYSWRTDFLTRLAPASTRQ